MTGRPAGGAAPSAAPPPPSRTTVSRSVDDTLALGEALGRAAAAGDLICLWGDLGAGKTQLTKGIARGLDISDTVNSPTFVLMSEYVGRLPLFHVDLYRLDDARDALGGGGVVDDRQSEGLTVVEWPDRMREVLAAERLDVVIDGTGEDPRLFEVVAAGPRYERYLEALR